MRKAFGLIVAVVLLLGVSSLIILGIHAKDGHDKAQATRQARAHWSAVRLEVARRIGNGQHPLQLGAVWMTHSGRICGLVDAGSALGGATGMTPFYHDGRTVRYRIETEPLDWANGWRECDDDTWLKLNHGSYETGPCVGRPGHGRCKRLGG